MLPKEKETLQIMIEALKYCQTLQKIITYALRIDFQLTFQDDGETGTRNPLDKKSSALAIELNSSKASVVKELSLSRWCIASITDKN